MGDSGLNTAALALRATHEGAAWRLDLAGARPAPCGIVFSGAGLEAPPLLDGAAMALLPAALALHHDLHLPGPVSRLGLRNLTDLAGAWANFAPARFGRIRITAEHVTDDPPPPTGPALLAWDGSFEAAAALARHAETTQPGALDIAGLVHVAGLAPAAQDAAVLAALRPLTAARGLKLVEITAAAEGACRPDPVIGRLPLVAAALHLAGASLGVAMGLVARRWPYAMLLGRQRPLPHLPDLLGGAGFAVRSDGGGTSAAELAAALAAHPTIGAAIRPATAQDSRLAALGFAAAGVAPPQGVALPAPLAAARTLDLADPVALAAAAALARAPGGGAAQNLLRARVRLAGWAELAGDYARWCGALLGTRAPWPR